MPEEFEMLTTIQRKIKLLKTRMQKSQSCVNLLNSLGSHTICQTLMSLAFLHTICKALMSPYAFNFPCAIC